MARYFISLSRQQRLRVLRADEHRTAADLERAYGGDEDDPGEHPLFARADWRDAVTNEITLLSYWHWCEQQVRAELYG